MKIILNNDVLKAKITCDTYPDNDWQLQVFNTDGSLKQAFRSRAELEDAELKIQQMNDYEFNSLEKLGWMPPYRKD